MPQPQAALPPIPVRIARGLDALAPPASASPAPAAQVSASPVSAAQVSAAMALLDEGATVPFIARYRKEATGGLDDVQLRALVGLLTELRGLERRREEVLKSIADQGALTPALEAELHAAETRERLDDLYLPYRPKYRSPGQIARERGLGPLADALLADPGRDPADQAAAYVDPAGELATADDCLKGARDILVERMAEDAELVASIRDRARREGLLRVEVVEGKEAEGARFRDWFHWQEPIATVPGHRALAFLRGRREEVLRLSLVLDEDHPGPLTPTALEVAARFGIRDQGRLGDGWLLETARMAARWRIGFHVELNLVEELRKRAHAEAIDVFAQNMRDVLLAAPAGPRPTMGLDPGLRTGVKVAVVDGTGKVVDTTTIYPHPPRKDWQGSLATLRLLAERHGVELVAVGNGTASRETDKLAGELCKACPGLTRVVVSEAGASVYSASELASRELPGLDVTLRGAVSIARRLQDPLAELVKIDPRSVGVGQYQHDVDEYQLSRALDGTVEDCVNAVGVDLNTASPALLRRVAGLDEWTADEIVRWRDEHGAFQSRQALRESLYLPARTFEQCAGFLRIRGGADPLDASAVHPEAYPVVHRILDHTGRTVEQLLGDDRFLARLDPRAFVDAQFGLPTVQDILGELAKPGRDPRPSFQTARFADGIETLADLKPGMQLEGTVTNVTAFGAFVDVGVHQDGLVHISQLADRFVDDPRQVVRTGQTVKVTVLEVDHGRKRIALSMKSQSAQRDPGRRDPGPRDQGRPPPRRDRPARPADRPARQPDSPSLGAMAAALQSALGQD
ncbi:MAG: RNA-binding transcriptional accessory protein [Alphaproteobacteria bacterium]|nr:RNA-binding transcriptional accessory protein [Alphaproteobacteria bacterium]